MRTDNAPRRQIDGLPGTASKTGVIKAYVLPTAAGGGIGVPKPAQLPGATQTVYSPLLPKPTQGGAELNESPPLIAKLPLAIKFCAAAGDERATAAATNGTCKTRDPKTGPNRRVIPSPHLSHHENF
jgi:hypothetical protein